MSKPISGTYPEYFKQYIDKVPENELAQAFKNQLPELTELLNSITEEKSIYAYDTGKWSLKELLQHMIDTERIFNYRALCIARNEKASLLSFDENSYAKHSNANTRKWKHMVEEFLTLRRTTEMLFESFTPEALETSGLSGNNPITVNSLGFTIIGHFYHHQKVIRERYIS